MSPNRTAWHQRDTGDLRRRLVVWGLVAAATVAVFALDDTRRHGIVWAQWAVLLVPVALVGILFGWRMFAPGSRLSAAEALRASPLSPATCPALFGAVEAMAVRTGLSVPQLWRIETPSLNAVIDTHDLIVTQGLIDALDERELTAVAAWLCGLYARDLAGSVLAVSIREGYRAWDAEAMRLSDEPAALLSALVTALTGDNHLPGAHRVPQARFMVTPDLSEAARRERLTWLQEMAGAAGAGGSTSAPISAKA